MAVSPDEAGPRLPADDRGGRSHRASAAPGPGDAGRRDGLRHHAGPVRMGMGELSPVLHPGRGHRHAVPRRRAARAATSARHRPPSRPAGRRPGPPGRGAGLRRRRRRRDGRPGRFDWDALDAWYEEDEQVFVHPRNPYIRVDALRSHPHVRVELDGVTLAETAHAGAGVRDRAADPLLLRSHRCRLRPSRRRQHADGLPVQGRHQRLLVGARRRRPAPRTSPGRTTFRPASCCPSRAWSRFTTRRLDIDVDGVRLPRPRTHFSQ